MILVIRSGAHVLALLFLSGLSACGQKGPLYLDTATPAVAAAASAPSAPASGAKAP